MIPKELFQQIRRIEITTSRLVTDIFAGQYHSVFKGQGIEFDEVRPYQYGDDIRTIDWNVTARTGSPHIKKFVEERELTVMILVDVSRSSRFASRRMFKSRLAAEASALLALSAIRNNDKVGLIIFTDGIERFIPPRKGRQHVLRVIRDILYFEPKGHSTDITQALEYLNRVSKRKTISFLVSDFFDENILDGQGRYARPFKNKLSVTNTKHDLIAVTLNDPSENELPDCGLIEVHDAEAGQAVLLDSASAQVRTDYRNRNFLRKTAREELFKRVGMDYIDLSTDEYYADAFVKFFHKRRGRR